jgi:hypothetical protein
VTEGLTYEERQVIGGDHLIVKEDTIVPRIENGTIRCIVDVDVMKDTSQGISRVKIGEFKAEYGDGDPEKEGGWSKTDYLRMRGTAIPGTLRKDDPATTARKLQEEDQRIRRKYEENDRQRWEDTKKLWAK